MSCRLRTDRETVMGVIKDDLLRWTCERHATDCPLDRHLLRDRALELADEYGLTGFKCSESWLTCFLKRYGFPLNLEDSSGPIFGDYRLWIDMMRPVIGQYKYKDLFHLDELTMYSDVPLTRISSTIRRTAQQDESNTNPKRAMVLMCCNASGTEKLPLLICGCYPAAIRSEDHIYSYSEGASINDELFREWLSRLNDRILRNNRKILLLLHRDRMSAFRDLELSNIRRIFFPRDFPPLLRPLKRDVFHFVKMIYRSKYVEGIGVRERPWNVENVVKSLVEAWRKVPRALIIASFQRTSFRTDDCFLEIHCDAWENLKTGVSFKKFVTFDDDISASASSHERRKSSGKNHNYNLRPREMIKLIDDDRFDSTSIDSRGKTLIDKTCDKSRTNENSKIIYDATANVDWKKKNSLKRSYHRAQLDQDSRDEANDAKSSDDLIVSPNRASENNEDVNVVPSSAKVPKIIGIEMTNAMESRGDTVQSAKSEEVDSTQTTVNPIILTSGANMDCVGSIIDKIVDCKKRNGNDRTSSDERSIESSPEVDGTSVNGVASQQVFRHIFAIDSDIKEANVEAVSGVNPRNEIESVDLAEVEGNDCHSSWKKPLKRKRSRPVSVEESQNPMNDGESERKMSKYDCDWTKQYEMTFVFGSPDVTQTVSTISDSILDDNNMPFERNNAQQSRPRRSCEMEKSIFTIRPRKD